MERKGAGRPQGWEGRSRLEVRDTWKLGTKLLERKGAGRPQGWEGSRLEVRDLIIGEAGSRYRPQGWEGSRLEVRDLIIGEEGSR